LSVLVGKQERRAEEISSTPICSCK